MPFVCCADKGTEGCLYQRIWKDVGVSAAGVKAILIEKAEKTLEGCRCYSASMELKILCQNRRNYIIQRNVNSKFSNMSPEAKKSTFREMIGKGSLKLRIMSELTEKKGNKTASACWKDEVCQAHEEEMIDILWNACYGEE